MDVPNKRSSHSTPTPRGGGIAPVLALIAALSFAGSLESHIRATLLLTLALFSLIGLAEDLLGVPILWRLLLQAGVAVALSQLLVRSPEGRSLQLMLAYLCALIFVVAYVNAFNFMDGINGLSVAQVLIAGSAWYAIGRLEGVDSFAIAGAAIAAAALGFAPFNVRNAQVFLGDVGSYALGAVLAALAILGMSEGIAPEAIVAPLTVYIADTGSTLLRRLARGDAWSEPHRDHIYQQLVRLGWSHSATTILVSLIIVLVTLLGSVSLVTVSVPTRMIADLAIVLLLSSYLASPRVVRRGRSTTASL